MRLLTCILLHFLLIFSAFSQNQIIRYESWFDGDYSNRTVVPVAPTSAFELNSTVPSSGLASGLHTYNIRFLDKNGKWSPVLSHFFYKMPGNIGTNDQKVIQYEYWFNADYAGKTESLVSPADQFNFNNQISGGNLSKGIHTFNIRFKDNEGQWSSILSQFIYKMPEPQTSTDRQMVEYEYWFDNDYDQKVSSLLTSNKALIINYLLPASQLPDGLHTFNIRFKDNSGTWSSTLSHFFYFFSTKSDVPNEIKAYRYWFNNSFSEAVLLPVSPSVKHFNLLEDFDLTGIQKGKHSIHFQFMDNLGLWSPVTTDSIISNTGVGFRSLTSDQAVHIFPNPTRGQMKIDMGREREFIKIKISDANSRILSETSYYNTQEIDLNLTWPAGIYFLEVISEGKQTVVWVVKQ